MGYGLGSGQGRKRNMNQGTHHEHPRAFPRNRRWGKLMEHAIQDFNQSLVVQLVEGKDLEVSLEMIADSWEYSEEHWHAACQNAGVAHDVASRTAPQ